MPVALHHFVGLPPAQFLQDVRRRAALDASRVVMEKDTHSRTTHRRSFYTDLTRARDAAVVVTDSALQLAQRILLDDPKVAALEVIRLGETGARSELERD